MRRQAGVTVIGEAIVDLIPAGPPRTFQAVPGGSPYNVAIGLARLGHHATLMARLADTAFGRILRDHAQAEGIDLHAAPDTHTWGSMYVRLRNDLSPNSKNTWIFAGDLVYMQENLRGYKPDDPEYIPIGFAMGSQFKLVMTTEALVKGVDGDINRVIAIHEDRLKDMFPSRVTPNGVRVTELALADGEVSRVS
jgi:hypothetical protein